MNIVLFGASGRIGRTLLKGLHSAFPEANITGCTRDENTAETNHLMRFDPFYDDWSQLGHVDILINAVGIFQEKSEADFDSAHGGLSSLIVCNRENIGNPKVIQISALGADEQSPLRFLQTKGAADRILLKSGNVVIVRPSIVCTPGTMLVQKLRMIQNTARFLFGRFPVPAGFLRTRIQPVMSNDLVDLIVTLCRTHVHPPILELTGPDVYTYAELPGLLNPDENSHIKLIELPFGLVDVTIALLGLFALPRPVTREQLRLLLQDNVASGDEARTLLGRPLTSTRLFWQQELSDTMLQPVRKLPPVEAPPSPE